TWVDGTYTVVATALDGYAFPAGEGVSEDGSTKTFTGSLGQLSGDVCAEVASAALSTTDPTCAADGTVVLGDIVGATWGEVTWNEGTFTVIATVLDGFLFPEGGEGVSDDRLTKTFTGSLQKLSGDDCLVVGDPTFVPAACVGVDG